MRSQSKPPEKEEDTNISNSGINKSSIKQDAEKLLLSANYNNENSGLLTVLSANKWIEQAKKRPIPKMLFSEFWFEGEICILFADTNLGKSILAVQICDSISKGEKINGFASHSDGHAGTGVA